jgi:hypothetical protein
VSTWRVRALRWSADLEDDVGGGQSLQVFVPSIMGVGILASVAILVADGLRRVNPRRSDARRRTLVSRRAHAIVAPVTTLLGVPAPVPPPIRRRLRSRRFYAELFMISAAMSLYVGIGSTANYLRPGGYLQGVLWMQVVATAASLFFLGIGVVALALVVRYPAAPRWARAVLDHSPLGALD